MTAHMTEHCACVRDIEGRLISVMTSAEELARFRALRALDQLAVTPCPTKCDANRGAA